MKIFYTSLLLLLTAACLAQVAAPPALRMQEPVFIPQKKYQAPQPNPQGLIGFYVDYAASDAAVFGNMGQNSFEIQLSGNNANFYRYTVVSLDTLVDPSLNAYAWNEIAYYRIDSVFAMIGHSNVSGDTNQIIMQIVNQGPNNYPNTTDPKLFSDTIFTDTSLTGLWNLHQQFSWAPMLVLDPSTYKTGAILKFANLGVGDRAGFSASYPIDGPCLPLYPATIVAKHSAFWPNSYTYYNQFGNQFPTSSNGDVYYDCDGDNNYVIANDGEQYIQDAHIWFYVSVHICDTGLTVQIDNHDWGTSNACATAFPGPGPAPYTYLWSNGGTDVQECNLSYGTRWVIVTDSVGCQDSASFIVLLVQSTQEEVAAKFGISVFPNPVQQVLTMQANEPIDGFELRDATGRLVRGEESHAMRIDKDLGDLQRGIYFLSLTGRSGWVYHRRIILQ